MTHDSSELNDLIQRADWLRRNGTVEAACGAYAHAVRHLDGQSARLAGDPHDHLCLLRRYWGVWFRAAETSAQMAGLDAFWSEAGDVELREEWLAAAEGQIGAYLDRILPSVRLQIDPRLRMVPRGDAPTLDDPQAIAYPLLLSADIETARRRHHAAMGRYRIATELLDRMGAPLPTRAHGHAGLGYVLACLNRRSEAIDALRRGRDLGDPVWREICEDMLESLDA